MPEMKTFTINGVTYDIRDSSAVPAIRTVNGKPLDTDISLTASDVGARDNTWMPTAEDVGARPNAWVPTAEDVGARPNTWMPTAEEVGAAPAGYGLGEGSPYPPNNSVDEAVSNGWYYVGSNMTGAPSVPGLNSVGYGSLLVINRVQMVTQEYYVEPHTGIGVYSIKLVRQKNNKGVWTEWEWVNPPMAVGIEYRTTERFEGKPVYAKLVDFGTLPNATYKTVSLGTTNGHKIVYCHAVTSTGAALPYTDTSNTTVDWMMRVKNVNGSTITIETKNNYSTLTALVFVKYTKTTD